MKDFTTPAEKGGRLALPAFPPPAMRTFTPTSTRWATNAPPSRPAGPREQGRDHETQDQLQALLPPLAGARSAGRRRRGLGGEEGPARLLLLAPTRGRRWGGRP